MRSPKLLVHRLTREQQSAVRVIAGWPQLLSVGRGVEKGGVAEEFAPR